MMLTSQSSRPCSGQILHHEYGFSVTEGQIDACKTSPKREEHARRDDFPHLGENVEDNTDRDKHK